MPKPLNPCKGSGQPPFEIPLRSVFGTTEYLYRCARCGAFVSRLRNGCARIHGVKKGAPADANEREGETR